MPPPDPRPTPPGAPEPWSAADFRPVALILESRQGHPLSSQRLSLVRTRLQSRLKARGVPSFAWFHDRVLRPQPQGSGMQLLIDLSTVNHTTFFREPAALNFLAERLSERLRARTSGPCRAWCAGCSAGQEPYSLAMSVAERLPILSPEMLEVWATDLSSEMIHTAARAVYEARDLEDVTPPRLRRFFLRGRGPRHGAYRVAPEVRKLVKFMNFDLRSGEWPIPGEFDAVLCRNVTMYFPEGERVALIDRLAGRLREGGWLALGNSEILPGPPRLLEKVAPSLYRRVARP